MSNNSRSDAIGVLFVCTGNQCRSPMAATLLRARLASSPEQIEVASAGFTGDGFPAPPPAIGSMAEIGLDMSGHRSRLVRPATVTSSDLVIGMTRQHVIDLAAMTPDGWKRCFTFPDLLRRAEAAGPRLPGQDLRAWAIGLHAGRSRMSLLALPLSDDVADPIGRRRREFDRTRDVLERMTARLAEMIRSA